MNGGLYIVILGSYANFIKNKFNTFPFLKMKVCKMNEKYNKMYECPFVH